MQTLLITKLEKWKVKIAEYWCHYSIIPFHRSGLIVLAIATLFFPVKSFGAETVKLRYLQSVYVDEKGVGMKGPEGIACNNKSLLIVADTGNNRLLQYTFQD